MNFIKNGTKVTIMDSELTGVVIGVCIRGVENCTIEYQVQWIGSGGASSEWLYDYQVKVYQDNSQTPGLVNYETTPATT